MNLLAPLPDPRHREIVTPLLARGGVRIERIVSGGQSSPPDFWYDQAEGEWVLVLEGWGEVEFEDGGVIRLARGDALEIPPHRRHRVRGTSPTEPTVWLAVFYPA